ncbi:MAG: hypothetical protein JWN44_4787 [Myxococcales bacterium]|nr:hypothetical protein [Myxococcales bacterium]
MGAAFGGCGPGDNPPPDGGTPPALDILGSSQIGLHYGRAMELRVRYHTDDASAAAIGGQTVRFSIFGDPAGSTLSRDQATTDATGEAAVTLTGGQAEAQFKVEATAANADNVIFDVAVSKLDFVNLEIDLSWPTPTTSTTLRALLYDDRSCAALPASPTLPAPFRALSKSNATFAALGFQNLLSKPYTVVGRAETAGGVLVGYGCVDVGAELVPPGSQAMLPLPLAPAVPSPVGTFVLTSQLLPDPAIAKSLMTRWQQFGFCKYGAASALLDAMGVTAMRDPVDADNCRLASTTSIDRQLEDLLSAPPTAPARMLDPIVEDLGGVTTSTTLKSRLIVTQSGEHAFSARHILQSATFSTGPSPKTWDLVAQGLPVIDVANIAVTDEGGKIGIANHQLTLGWTTLWKQAFVDLSLAVRVSGLGSPAVKSLVTAVVLAAARNGKVGCAAVEDLLCSVLGGACSYQAACGAAIDTIAANLDAPFAPASGIDLTLGGSAQSVDADGDLQVDLLTGGSWVAPGLQPSTFSGARQ